LALDFGKVMSIRHNQDVLYTRLSCKQNDGSEVSNSTEK